MRMRDKIKLQQDRIDFLEKIIRRYYNAIYELKGSVDYSSQNMIRGISSLCGNESKQVVEVPASIKKEILELPLFDCGIR